VIEMTSGTVLIGTPAKVGSKNGHFYYRKVWSGQDGRTEVIDGVHVRDKWNNYSLIHDSVLQSDFATGPANGTGTAVALSSCPPKIAFKAQSKLTAKVKKHEFNLAVNAAQGKQTVDLLVGNIQKLGRSLLLIKRGRFGDAARQLGVNQGRLPLRELRKPGSSFRPVSRELTSKDISGRWLELQYGWLPFIQDSFEASKALAAMLDYRRETFSAVAKYDEPVRNTSASPSTHTVYSHVYGYMKYVLELSEEMSKRQSLGLEDPLSVIWEIVPYSFCLDWFLPVGSYLESAAVLPKLQGRHYSTWFSKLVSNFAGANPSVPFNTYLRIRSCVAHSTRMTRSVGPGAPSLVFPSFSTWPEAMSPRRIFSAVALAHQRLEPKRDFLSRPPLGALST
jgi:hypothetical protein